MNLLFDLDGTLINSKNGIYNAYKLSLENYIEPIGEKEFEYYIGPTFSNILTNIHPDLDISVSKTIISNFRRLYDCIYYKEFIIYDGMVDLIQKVSTFSQCFIVTNKPTKPSIEILKKLKLNYYFKEIVGVNYFSNIGLRKRDNISKLIANNNLSKIQTFYIGDTKADLDAAKQNNINFIAFKEGYYKWKKYELVNTFFYYKKPSDLYLKLSTLINT